MISDVIIVIVKHGEDIGFNLLKVMAVVPEARSVWKNVAVGIDHREVAEFAATPYYVAIGLINLVKSVCVSDV